MTLATVATRSVTHTGPSSLRTVISMVTASWDSRQSWLGNSAVSPTARYQVLVTHPQGSSELSVDLAARFAYRC